MSLLKSDAAFGIRVTEYLEKFPKDASAVKAISVAASTLGAKSARDVAEITAGRRLTADEWQKYGPRWQRVWSALLLDDTSQ